MRELTEAEMEMVSGAGYGFEEEEDDEDNPRTVMETVHVYGTRINRGGGYSWFGQVGGINAFNSDPDKQIVIQLDHEEEETACLDDHENMTEEELENHLNTLSDEDMDMMQNFLSGFQAQMEKLKGVAQAMGGTALQYVDELSNLSRIFGAASTGIDGYQIYDDLRDGEFTIEEQADAFAAVSSIMVAATLTRLGQPGLGFFGAIIFSFVGDEAYEAVAGGINQIEDSINQFLTDNPLPMDSDTGLIDIEQLFGVPFSPPDFLCNPSD